MIATPNKPLSVIPAHAGIQNGRDLDPGVRRGDGFSWGIHD